MVDADESGRNFATLLIDGSEILPRLLADLAQARRNIHVSMFLWFDDPVGDEIANLLIVKAGEGVKIRVLLNVEKTAMGDPFSTGEAEMMKHDPSMHHDPTDAKPLCKRLTAAGIEVHDTNIAYEKVVSGLSPRLTSIAGQIRDTIEIDALHIDHRKLVIIDDAIGYCGGANLGAQYLFHVPFDPAKDSRIEGEERARAGLPEPWWKWHDSLTRFEGPIVRALEEYFRDRFLLDGGADYTVDDSSFGSESTLVEKFPVDRVEIFHNEPNNQPNAIRELYVRLIRGATHSVFIENPYLYHPSIVDALCDAKEANRSLKVTLILTGREWNDSEFSHDAQQHGYGRYLALGIEVYEYQNHFNHLKMAVFDERYSIHGSTNLNFRSLEDDNDFELVVLVDHVPLARHVLERVRDVDVTRAKRFAEEDLDFRVRNRDPRTLLLVSRKEL
jgi:cardiolipin synthase